jgi:hypothetical protein
MLANYKYIDSRVVSYSDHFIILYIYLVLDFFTYITEAPLVAVILHTARFNM